MTLPMMACRYCVWFLHAKKCAAFDQEIPDEIWFGKNDHTEPYPGDNGIQFEPIDETEQAQNA